jgi:hypothetical protein
MPGVEPLDHGLVAEIRLNRAAARTGPDVRLSPE